MATLFWSVPDGPENQQVTVECPGVSGTRMTAKRVSASDVLPAGTAAGQLLYWTGTEWAPTPTAPADGQFAQWDETLNQWIFVDGGGGTTLPDGDYPGQPLVWDGAAWVQLEPGLPAALNFVEGFVGPDSEYLELRSDAAALTDGTRLRLQNDVAVLEGFVGGETLVSLAVDPEDSAIRLEAVSPGAGFTRTIFEIVCAAGIELQVGFFGAPPAPQQSITGASTQEQVDSIVSALVAFGLVVDNR